MLISFIPPRIGPLKNEECGIQGLLVNDLESIHRNDDHHMDRKDNQKAIDNDTTACDKREIMGELVKQLHRSMANEELI